MTLSKKPIPEGFHTVTPGLIVKNAAEAINFYKRALGAEELMRMPGPDGKGIMHAEIKIGDSIIFVSDESPHSNVKSPQSIGGSTVALNVYVPDVDAAFQKAIDAGGKETMPVADQFWGDRYGTFVDPFGYTQEMSERAKAFFAQAQSQQKSA